MRGGGEVNYTCWPFNNEPTRNVLFRIGPCKMVGSEASPPYNRNGLLSQQ